MCRRQQLRDIIIDIICFTQIQWAVAPDRDLRVLSHYTELISQKTAVSERFYKPALQTAVFIIF